MPRKRKSAELIICKKCGYSWNPKKIKPEKTWHMVSPIPDKEGRITVTVLGIWICPNCKNKVRGVVSKMKIGSNLGKSVNRTALLLEELGKSDKISLKELAEKFNFSIETIKRAIDYLVRKGEIQGMIKGDYFIRKA